MIKKILATILVFTMISVLFIPVFATETDITEEETEEAEEVAEETASVISSVEVSPEQVLDYTKMYHLATITVGECSRIKWYIIKEDGSVYNWGYKDNHHGATYEILWNSLDSNGQHPAGEWNKPTTVRFSLVIVATGIDGSEDVFETWFEYTWYDNDRPTTQATTEPTTTQPTTSNPVSSDVPHTGLGTMPKTGN